MEVEQQDQLAECLINSLKRKEVKKAKKALENGADPNYIGPEGFAAIHLAAGLDGGTGQQLLNLMLMYGGNPNLKSSENETALHVAVMWNRDTATRLLLANGADPTIRNLEGLTAFDLAGNTSDQELKCLELLRNKLDNSSESDTPLNERSSLFVPAQNLNSRMKPNDNRQCRVSRSNEFGDAPDGLFHDMSSQMRNMQGYPSPLSNQETSPSFTHYPYNPTWIQHGNDIVLAPLNSQPMSSGVYAPQLSPPTAAKSCIPQRDSFFDISVPEKQQINSLNLRAFGNVDQYSSETDGSMNTAFNWDSDIDSSTSYFSLPKHSLRGLITELKDGEERVISHKGVNGEASVIIGSDFESRISLGEIPLSLIKNTNESILNEQLKKTHGRKSAEKLYLRRAKLNDMHSSKKIGRNQNIMRSSPETLLMSPINTRMQRPTRFRSPFPLLTIPSHSFGQNATSPNYPEQSQTREIAENPELTTKVDKTTQKYLDSTEGEDNMETRSNMAQHNHQKSASKQNTPPSKSVPCKVHGVSRMTQVGPSAVNHGSSADINMRTPTTDETFSQPGNEETENEFSLLHTIGSPRALYADMNETPSTLRTEQTLFDRDFLKPSMERDGKIGDGDIFKFGPDAIGNVDINEKGGKNYSKIQRKIDVLDSNETDVFPVERESGAAESDGNSSGYSGDMSQTSSPDDVASASSMPKFDLKNSPSVTLRNKRRKGAVDGSNAVAPQKQLSTDSSNVTETEEAVKTKTALSASPRKRLNGVASSSDEANPQRLDGTKSPVPPKKNMPNSPGQRIRQRVDHTFGGNSAAESPLLPDDLRAYHKAQLEKSTNRRRQWETKHKNGCLCELCMTKKGQAAATASLPYCEHDQCNESEEYTLNDVTIDIDWKDVSLMESTNTEHSLVISEEIKSLNVEELKQRLIKAGMMPGPITNKTMNVYLRHLARIEAGAIQTENNPNSSFLEYLPEMRKELQGIASGEMSSLEDVILKDFENPQKQKWREGTQKKSFNYLLLDPRVISGLADKSRNLTETEKFSCFIRSIFYIGKGKESRPYEHLHGAVQSKKSNVDAAKASAKLKMILNIWKSGYGVISLHVFHNSIPVEAYTREACMIEALGLNRLTNLKHGDYYGQAATWGKKRKRQLGIHLLKKALKILQVEGQKQIKEEDL